MSYCVNCGVELAPSQKECPLCQTAVVNPNSPWKEPRTKPYPDKVERVMSRIDRRYGAILGTLCLLIPVVVTTVTDLLLNSEFVWSPYVVGAIMCAFVFILVPWFVLNKRYYLFILLDAIVSALYLAYISGATSDFAWFLPLALPLVVVAAVLAAIIVLVTKTKHLHGLYKPASIMDYFAVACVSVELLIDMYTTGSIALSWSLIVLATLAMLSVILVVIEKKQKLKESIRRRLFV